MQQLDQPMLSSTTDAKASSPPKEDSSNAFRVGRIVALSMESGTANDQMNDLRPLHARSCRMTCCRACGGAITGLSVGVVFTFVVASLRMPLTLAQTLTGFFACWVLGALIGAVTGALCHRRRSPSCARVYPPKRIARHVHSSAPVPVVVSSVAAMLALLLLVIPSFPQEKLVSVAWLVTSLIHPQVDLPAGYCKSMNATQEDDSDGGGGGGGTQGISNRRRLEEASTWDSAEYQTPDGPTDGPKAWDDAEHEAALKVALMTDDEKMRLVQGVGWSGWSVVPGFYVGSILGVPRVGLKSINMQDAAQGFRTLSSKTIGQVTSWPCALALASTWDRRLARQWGVALGREFKAKGANVILGPSVNVHRVARNGRNAEYLSGEDGALGAPLAAAYVEGVQGEGVAAVVKHFALNSQETHRDSQSSDASDRTLWEVYYPPFEAAVRAGVAAFMCGYNKVNGSYVCGNSHVLERHLKRQMHFRGWVMSDWWATHDTGAAARGVDQNMPGSDGFFDAANLRIVRGRDGFDLDAMARRIVAGMLAAGAWRDGMPRCTAGCDCGRYMWEVNATRPEHTALARQIGAESVALLKNDGGVLPLRRGAAVALLGSACAAAHFDHVPDDWTAGDYYVVGGSGRVVGPYAVSVAAGLRARGVDARVEPSDDVEVALAAARAADVAIVCGGATTTESRDRSSLRLDQHELITSLAARLAADRAADAASAPPLVVLTLAPGAVVAPWAADASAVANMFMGGQEAGHAWADVLLGDVSPSGKLPVTFPLSEEGTVPPCSDKHCSYDERLLVGWRGLHGVDVAFPFGHGLSYTSFAYAWDVPPAMVAADDGGDGEMRLSLNVSNTGGVAGAEVAQIYVAYPAAAGEPALVLRAYAKTAVLPPGATERLSFSLSRRDLSTWNEHGGSDDADGSPLGDWQLAVGQFTVHAGASSRDLRLQHAIDVQ